MKYWHCNSQTTNNMNHMIRRNSCYIGLGNDIHDYNHRISKNKNTTPHQFNRFQENAQPGDIILLYQNKKGYVAYGVFTGVINEPVQGRDIAPDWSRTEIQRHIQVESWNNINNPSTEHFKIQTLVEIKKNPVDTFNTIINL